MPASMGVTPRLLRTTAAAKYLATSPWKIRQLAADGILPHIADGEGSPWRFDIRDLDKYVDKVKAIDI